MVLFLLSLRPLNVSLHSEFMYEEEEEEEEEARGLLGRARRKEGSATTICPSQPRRGEGGRRSIFKNDVLFVVSRPTVRVCKKANKLVVARARAE